jgi:hypothetical protein
MICLLEVVEVVVIDGCGELVVVVEVIAEV